MRSIVGLAVGVCLVCAVFRGVAAESFPSLVGDGVVDDTAAIQARLDSGMSCVYLPPPAKCYLISKTPSNTTGDWNLPPCKWYNCPP